MEIIGYFVEEHGNPKKANDVIVAIQRDTVTGRIEVYSPIEQHAQADVEYVHNKCKAISKEQYLAASKGWDTPADYL